MFLTLIGMSGTGKSYWSKNLESAGFTRFGCDDLITERLALQLGMTDSQNFDMHAYVGYPDEVTHTERASQYLQCEQEVVAEIIQYLSNAKKDENIVIDTTGSVIYMPDGILTKMSQMTTVVYLDITPQDFKHMLQYYLSNPVAIIWNGIFQPYPDESRQKTFERCYPQLIKSRQHKYLDFADIIIHPDKHRAAGINFEDFLSTIQSNSSH
ncbi:MAG: hypothetical protein Q7U53_00370 [Anaerolineaceae bacterium]|nr:hypothetical protein [Anaerolineaceae bacterium]